MAICWRSVISPTAVATLPPPVATALRRKGHASGIASNEATASVYIADAHPAAAMTNCTMGANTNCPSEPPALMKPAANDRFSGASCCAVAPIRIEKLPAPAPAAVSTPSVNISPHCEGIRGVSASPSDSSTPPKTSTPVEPRLSAIAPKTGCTAPQVNCPMASAKLIAAIPMPVLWWIGVTNRPVVCRAPMVIINMPAAASSRPQCMRGADDSVVVFMRPPRGADAAGRPGGPVRHAGAGRRRRP